MAVTNQQIIDYLLANPNLSDAQIAAAMQEYNVTPAQMAAAVGLPTEAVQERYIAAAPNTYTAENVNKLASQILSQGTTEAWTGGLPPEKAALYMADELAKSGVTNIAQVAKGKDGIINSMTGEKLISGYGERTGGNLWSGSYEGKGNTGFGVNFDQQGNPVFYTQGASSSTLKNDILKLAAVAGAVYGIGGFDGLLGSTLGAAEGATAFDLANAGIAGGSSAFTPAQLAAIEAGQSAYTGAGLLTGAQGVPLSELLPGASNLATATNVADITGALGATESATAFDLANAGIAGGTSAFTPAQLALIESGASAAQVAAAGGTGLLTGAKTASELAAEKLATDTAAKTAATSLTAEELAKKAATSVAASELAKKVADTASTASGLFQTTGSLIQSQESKEAAQKAASDITKATQTAQEAAQFRPVGMTTRFGTSQYTYDPVTGRMISAGYQLSPEAKAAQDRLVALAGRGLTQAEQAQQQFAPLQQGATNLFNLGNRYISQSPEQVAQDYINKQMALLQPSREMELANLQNRLYQQGRGGVSVAQGGTLGATTPELQALYNARAQQELQLAANAQQAGQQNTLFGAGLLGQGAQAMGNYYGGQTQAYQPFTTALGQVQGLETAAQQPLTMGANLAQLASTAGARAGQLGLTGQQLSSAYSTGANATYNPYAGVLTAAGNPNSMFGQVAAGAFAPGGVVDRYLYPSGNPLQTGALADPGLWT